MRPVSKLLVGRGEEKPMFEDSLIESGNRFKAKRRLSTTILSFRWQVRADRSPDSDPADLYRCAAQDAADDVSGRSAATAAAPAPASGGSGQSSEDR